METQAARHVLVKQTHTGALARLWRSRLRWRSVWRCVKSSHCLPTAPVISAWTCFAAFSIKFALGVLVHYVGLPLNAPPQWDIQEPPRLTAVDVEKRLLQDGGATDWLTSQWPLRPLWPLSGLAGTSQTSRRPLSVLWEEPGRSATFSHLCITRWFFRQQLD